MTATTFDERLAQLLRETPDRVPLVVGPCGSGRTTALLRLQRHLGPSRCQYVDLERVATTPERFLDAILAASPFRVDGRAVASAGGSARDAFDRVLTFLASAHTDAGTPAVFLLDEVIELKTFESFPGLRRAVDEFCDAIASSPNRFVLTSRYAVRATRLVGDACSRIDLLEAPPLPSAEVERALVDTGCAPLVEDAPRTAALVVALSSGRPAYAQALVDETATTARGGVADPVGALAALMAHGARLDTRCRFCYELRLHRARGYGALKAILDVLALEQPLSLTEVAHRLRRTPGSTRDYLAWLEDVDLIVADRKKYRVADPLLRMWIRLSGRPGPPSDEDVAREVQRYAVERLPVDAGEPAPVAAARPARDHRDRAWGIIEID